MYGPSLKINRSLYKISCSILCECPISDNNNWANAVENVPGCNEYGFYQEPSGRDYMTTILLRRTPTIIITTKATRTTKSMH